MTKKNIDKPQYTEVADDVEAIDLHKDFHAGLTVGINCCDLCQ
jgi:hypothetical protein